MADPSTPVSPDTHSSTCPAEGAAIDPPSRPSYGVPPEHVYVQAYNPQKNQTLSEAGARGSESNFTDTPVGRGPSSPSVENHVSSIPTHQQHLPKSWEELPLGDETPAARLKRIDNVLVNCRKHFGGEPPESVPYEEFVCSEDECSVP